MFYQINDKYYVKVGRKYIEVVPEINGKEVNMKPNNKSYLEDNGMLKVKTISLEEISKKKMEHREKRNYERPKYSK